MMRSCNILFVIFYLAFSLPVRAPGIIYVAWDASGSGNGSSWENAFQTISPAVTAAQEADHIWVKKGTYIEQVILQKNISLYGGFAGTETDLEQRNISLNETILDGTGKSYSEVLMTKGRLDGFTILGGQGTTRTYKDVTMRFGGCILVDYDSTDPVISHCRITKTETPEGGFALACLYAGNLLIEDCLVEQNRSPLGIDGILVCNNATVAIRRCIIRDNDGEGLFCDYKNSVTVEDSEFLNNKKGGIWFCGTTVDVKRCVIRGNSWRGMNFYYDPATGLVADCVIEENNTDNSEDNYFGGGIYLSGGSSPTFYNCLIRKNRVALLHDPHGGGGIMIYGASPTFIRCRIEENTSYDDTWSDGGGGVYILYSSLVNFYNTMFLNNYSLGAGACYIEKYSNAYFNGCIFSGNYVKARDSQVMFITDNSNVYLNNCASTGQLISEVFSLSVHVTYTYSNLYSTNNILWDGSPEIRLWGGAQAYVDHTCIIGGFPGEGNISSNPLFIDEGYTSKTAGGEWLWEEGYYM
ncbi:right-handed parallel beta-helix repeat-containing protein, partial [Candidatus Sumerlaeota bacterium]|nr:right-handed parallel beta-helix repeat-containing protein [Candidatus Sumerlaeota bacterium]